MSSAETTIFDFNEDSNITSWSVVDDVVMGGRSNGRFFLNEEHNGVFQGHVSLENNGGFSSLRHIVKDKSVINKTHFIIRVKGDGKRYQFRSKKSNRDNHSYIAYFNTNGNWQTIEIPFDTMEPAFRGRMLDMPNYNGGQLEEVAFLIGNKKEQDFKLEIDFIKVK